MCVFYRLGCITLIIDTFADTKISKNVQLYYQKVVVLPVFVTFPFSRSQKMTQML